MVLPAVLLYFTCKKMYFSSVFLRFVKNEPFSKYRKSFGTGSIVNYSLSVAL
jgi:hypothetical protein